jgi:hypothetical protein
LNDLDLGLKCSQISLAEDDGLPQSLLFLQDTFALIVKEPFGRQIARAHETGEHDLCCQFRFLLLQDGFAVLEGMPGLVQALSTRQEGLHLEFQFDTLPPQEFAPLGRGIAGWLSILIALLIVVVMLLIAMGVLLLIGHKKFPFLVLLVHFVTRVTSSMKAGRINLSWYF